jgi:hypothetical protein
VKSTDYNYSDGQSAYASLKDKAPGLLERKPFMQGTIASDEISISIKEECEEDEDRITPAKHRGMKQGHYRFEDDIVISHDNIIMEHPNEDQSIEEG